MVEQENHIKITEEQKILKILEEVKDPEVPVLSVIDLGIVREVKIISSRSDAEPPEVKLTITPTYSCPALKALPEPVNKTARISLEFLHSSNLL